MEQPTIRALLSEASTLIGAVPKGEQQQNFRYRGIDQVIQAVSGPFRDLGIIVTPHVHKARYETVEVGRNRSHMQSCRVTVDHTYQAATASDTLTTRVIAESMDSGDKAAAKAMSVALRISLLQTLMLPTHDRDPDADSPERSPQRGMDQVEELILGASTVEELRALWVDAGRHDLRPVLLARRKDIEAESHTE